jgi:UDP-N-acetylmuramyl tripeptide synthase
LYFAETGAVLEVVGPGADDASAQARWRERIEHGRCLLGWPDAPIVVRPHPGGATLAFAAPVDQLFCATELNEWAWLATVDVAGLFAPGHPASWDEDSAFHTLRLFSAAEARPDLVALLAAAKAHALPQLLDDDRLTLGLGEGGRTWSREMLPAIADVPWPALHGIPTALVTGSNGKTTTVRLLAALLRAHGLRCAHSCTDGVFFEGRALVSGDYSGPAGARTVLRHPDVAAAVLETARGGILRRGLAVDHADVAVVTNISADHYGEYGIHDLEDLADTKLTVAHALRADGLLVVNADDDLLRAKAMSCGVPLAWFALDDAHPTLVAQRALGGMTCGVANGHLLISVANDRHDLGEVAAMPLTADGHAGYNIANIAAASLAAVRLGVSTDRLRQVLASFGNEPADNPGRLQRWTLGDVQVLMDYAHNPDGLRGLMTIAATLAGGGRLALLLGQAGNRGNTEIRDLAKVAAEFTPRFVVLKDIDGYLRGRAPGEVAGILKEQLLLSGFADADLPLRLAEADAAREALRRIRSGEVLVLPVHAAKARIEVAAFLDRLRMLGWKTGEPLPGE